jgi:hypothetical protein
VSGWALRAICQWTNALSPFVPPEAGAQWFKSMRPLGPRFRGDERSKCLLLWLQKRYRLNAIPVQVSHERRVVADAITV